jgi:hypothetical protein
MMHERNLKEALELASELTDDLKHTREENEMLRRFDVFIIMQHL